ncbi:MAG: hypothetical protein HOI35_05190 [Woeseia sp.]|jgi:hypothetical protein|nr:hypothetical protein [Woeseia sp.]
MVMYVARLLKFLRFFGRLVGATGPLMLTACNSEIYVRDGVTDGDTFYLAERALTDDGPVLQSWVRYSLTKSTCQLQIGGENPARASSLECELSSRRMLLDAWNERKHETPDIEDSYLDELVEVQRAGFLSEYVVRHFRKNHWELPQDIDGRGYRRWQRHRLPNHKPDMRIIGSWNYARKVSP